MFSFKDKLRCCSINNQLNTHSAQLTVNSFPSSLCTPIPTKLPKGLKSHWNRLELTTTAVFNPSLKSICTTLYSFFVPAYFTGYKFVDDGIDGMFFLLQGNCASGKFALSTSCAGRFSTWLLTHHKRLSPHGKAHSTCSSSSSSPVMVTHWTQSVKLMNLNS